MSSEGWIAAGLFGVVGGGFWLFQSRRVAEDWRRISLEDSQRFEQFHVAAYERFGFELVRVPPLPIDERVALVRSQLGLGTAPAMNAV